MNGGFAKDFYRKGDSVNGSGRFSEPPHRTLKTEKLLSSSLSRKSAPKVAELKRLTCNMHQRKLKGNN